MLPTPSTTHVPFDQVYEPAEDSFLLLDTLSAASETAFLQRRFTATEHNGVPLIVEVGVGSGVVLAFVTANSRELFGHPEILTLGTDINSFACRAARETIDAAVRARNRSEHGSLLATINTDLAAPFKKHAIDVLIFNPPYVPTEALPDMTKHRDYNADAPARRSDAFERDSHLLALSYAGGADGMEVTDRLIGQLPHILSLERGVAYVLLCAQNKPDQVKERIRDWGHPWRVETVGSSGKKGGWEKLQIIRIWRSST
jgi:release factor glutamine methyltransferase